MSAISFGLRLPPCRPATDVAGFAAAAEAAGFDTVWFPEQFLWRDVWSTVALAATRTERIRLGTAVTNFETRDPAVTASAAATVEELAPRRFVLAVGTGDSAVKSLGRPPTRLAALRDHIAIVRRLIDGEALSFGASGAYAHRVMRVRHAPGYRIPVHMAATAPKALALAGEVADGVIVANVGVAPRLLEAALARVRQGAAAAGRSVSDLEVTLAAHTAVADTEDEAARLVKPLVLTAAQLGGGEALRAAGIDVDVPPVVPGVYPDVTHAEDWEAAIDAAALYVSDDAARRYADAFCLAGPPDRIIQRIEGAVAAGVTSFYVLGLSSYELPSAILAAFRDAVLPRFR